MRACSKCGIEKDASEFYRDGRYRDGIYPVCKACKAAYHRTRREVDPEYRAADNARRRDYHHQTHRLKRYGITTIEFFDMFVAQGRKCAICGSPDAKGGRPDQWCIDHDHKTGRVRGILCHECNMALGHVESLLDEVGPDRLAAYIKGDD